MFILLSPAKKQDFEIVHQVPSVSQIRFSQEAGQLVKTLLNYSPAELSKLMKISEDLAMLNWERFRHFDPQHYTQSNSQCALFAFRGDVYQGLDADSLSAEDLQFCQNHLGILSGLYGLLRPLDWIQPYRLEMKTPLKTDIGSNLYAFWGNKLTEAINQSVQENQHQVVINLASEEYFKAVQARILSVPCIKVDFKEKKNGKLQTIGIYAKRARGRMARFIIENQLSALSELKRFDWDDYRFLEEMSSATELVFAR